MEKKERKKEKNLLLEKQEKISLCQRN